MLITDAIATGDVDVRTFYIRRTFRIFPLYYLVLGVYAVVTAGMGAGRAEAQA